MHFAEAFAATHREQPIRYAADPLALSEWHHSLHGRKNPTDKLPSLAFSDWLEENDEPAKAAFIRRAAAEDVQHATVGSSGSIGDGAHGTIGAKGAFAGEPYVDARMHGYGQSRIDLVFTQPHPTRPEWVTTLRYGLPLDPLEAHAHVTAMKEEGVKNADTVLQRLHFWHPALSPRNDEEQPVQHRRDGDPLIRRKLNLKHQKNRAERNRKLTPAELAAKIRDLVAKSPRTLSKVQSALRLDATATAAAISEGERSGVLKTVPTARGRRVEPHSGPSPHTPASASDSMSDSAHYAREFARHFAAYRAPEGGVAVKGVYYPGGQLVPDLTKFAAEPKVAEEIAMAPTGSYRGSQQFAPVRDAEAQVIRPAGSPYRGSQQLRLIPWRPGLKSPPPKSPPAKPKPKPKDDGVPIRRRTAKPSLIDRLRKLIAANLQPTRYSRGDHSHEAFHAAIHAAYHDSGDKMPSYAYSDHLEENGHEAAGQFVRKVLYEGPSHAGGVPYDFDPKDSFIEPRGIQPGDHFVDAYPDSPTTHRIALRLTSKHPTRARHARGVSFAMSLPHAEAREWLSRLDNEGVVDADLARVRLDRHVARNSAPAA